MDFRKKSRNARAFVVLLAALIALLLNIKYERLLIHSLIIVLVVIVVFYVVATIAIRLIEKISNMDKDTQIRVDEKPEEDQEKEQEEDTNEEKSS